MRVTIARTERSPSITYIEEEKKTWLFPAFQRISNSVLLLPVTRFSSALVSISDITVIDHFSQRRVEFTLVQFPRAEAVLYAHPAGCICQYTTP